MFRFSLSLFIMCIALQVQADFIQRSDARALNLEQSLEGITGLKVFWWNIACSSTKGLNKLPPKDRADMDPVNQWKNLEALVGSSAAPDIIILGEYCPKYFQQRTYDLLKKNYKNIFRLNKSNDLYRVRNGFRVFSKFKIETMESSALPSGDFLESQMMKTCFAEHGDRLSSNNFNPDFWKRPLLDLKVQKGGRSYSIAPVHLANPWRLMKACLGTWGAGSELASGVTNPNYSQAAHLVEHFSGRDSQILIGDFNAPKAVPILGSKSKSYATLTRGFGNSVIRSDESTFIDKKSNFGSHSLDHAFVSDNLSVQYGQVLPLAGSDHLPIYIVVE